jgi:hypothetical protein
MATRADPFPFHADVLVRVAAATAPDPGAVAALAEAVAGDPEVHEALEILRVTAQARARHHAGRLGLDPGAVSASVRNLNA